MRIPAITRRTTAMNDTDFAWESLLKTDAPAGSPLKAALFTTYERVDERLFVEHLLPVFLKLSREPDGEGRERQYFLLELDQHLKRLHDQIVVVSSAVYDELPGDESEIGATYGWIWRSIRHLTVGRLGKAVQHAKLWMLHWGGTDADKGEYLEIVVSSANLTGDALKGQMQAAWRACLSLQSQRSAERLSKWGVLPRFLAELAKSAGDEERLNSFVELLARAVCPNDVTFIASVPGTHTRQTLRTTPWGIAGLNGIAPLGRGTVAATIFCPFVGAWNSEALRLWCERFEGAPSRLRLIWIDRDHLWAIGQRWLLPAASLDAIRQSGGTLLHLPNTGESTTAFRFHDNHRGPDPRWSHAKVYMFQRGRSRRLLVTSANFSPSAWGREHADGSITIENFELGVCTPGATWPLDQLGELDPSRAFMVSGVSTQTSSALSWARAIWDGRTVHLECRCARDVDLRGAVHDGVVWTEVSGWRRAETDGDCRCAEVPWTFVDRVPILARLTWEQGSLLVPVFDEHRYSIQGNSLPSEVDADLAQAMCDELLFERYGGPVADALDNIAGEFVDSAIAESEWSAQSVEAIDADGAAERIADPSEMENDSIAAAESYAMPALEWARHYLRMVDNWLSRLQQAQDTHECHSLRQDGESLQAAFHRQATREGATKVSRSIGAKLAAEEIAILLQLSPREL